MNNIYISANILITLFVFGVQLESPAVGCYTEFGAAGFFLGRTSGLLLAIPLLLLVLPLRWLLLVLRKATKLDQLWTQS